MKLKKALHYLGMHKEVFVFFLGGNNMSARFHMTLQQLKNILEPTSSWPRFLLFNLENNSAVAEQDPSLNPGEYNPGNSPSM